MSEVFDISKLCLSESDAGPGDWPEDFKHENGMYFCECFDCGNSFTGHKRRVTCKSCTKTVLKIDEVGLCEK